MYFIFILTPFLKGDFLCQKSLTNHKNGKQQPRKVFDFTCSSHSISVELRLRRDSLIVPLVWGRTRVLAESFLSPQLCMGWIGQE